jgi:YHS domain-containing protein
VQDPEPFLQGIAAAFPCAVDPSQGARLDAAHRIRMNYEVFYVASESKKKRFESNPTRHCGVLTDPVSRVRFRPGRRSPYTTYEGRRYYFAADSSFARFQSNPTEFALPTRPRPAG